MKVFVTGATGLVGAHTALALLHKGHDVRLLVRNGNVAKRYFDLHGFNVNDIVEADMRQKDVVRKALQGCDAVMHAAAMVSLDPRKAAEIYSSNLYSISSVVESAAELGINNIVYVSSVGAFFDPANSRIDETTPLANPVDPYARSKCDCEAYVRKLQGQGVPIQITYPSGIFGPDDPKLNESNHSILSLLKIVPITSSGIQFVDARDLARAHVILLESPVTSRISDARYMVAGHYFPWPEFHRLLEEVTGRSIFAPQIPPHLLRFAGAIMDYVKRIYPVDVPVSSGSMDIVTRWREVDSSKFCKAFNFAFRSGEETFAETLAWLCHAGYASRKDIGRALDFVETRGNQQ